MADKNKPGNGENGDFGQDDPFAELARLIGPRDDAAPAQDQRPPAPETADDLADELLREFEAFPSHYERSREDEAPTFERHEEPRSEGPRFEQTASPEAMSIWDELPPVPVDEGPDDEQDRTPFADAGEARPEYERAPEYPSEYAAPYDDEPVQAVPEPVAPSPVAEPPPVDDDELALDLDELAQELAEIELADSVSGPLDDATASDTDTEDDFDPAALITTEEPPAPVDELDLPRMSDDEAVPVRASPDPYEFDLDEELADALASHPALVDPLQETQAQPEEPEEPDYYRGDETAAYEQAYQQAAAAQTVRAEDEAVQEDNPDEDYYDFDERERRPGVLASTFGGGGRAIMIGAGAVVLAVLFVFAGMRYFSGETGGEPVVISADNSSVKEAPEDPGGEVVPNQDNAVFNDISGTLAAPPRQDSLIASDQQPTDIENVAPNPLANNASEADSGGLEPRKVRTVIVRPDGTLVERETVDTGAEASSSPSSSVRGLETVTAMPDDNGQLVVASTPAESGNTGPENTAAPAATAAQTLQPGETSAEPVDDTAEQNATAEDFGIANVPLPTRRPAGGAPARVAAATPATTAAPAATAAPASQTTTQSPSRYAMQIASLPSEQEAQQAYRRLSAQHPALLGRRPVEFVPATISGKGTYYRVRIVANSLSEALSLCESYKAEGGSCYVPR